VTGRGTWSAPGAQDRGLHREPQLPVMFLDLDSMGGVKTEPRFERTVPSVGLDFYRGFLLFRVVFPQIDSPRQTLDKRSVFLSLPCSDGGLLSPRASCRVMSHHPLRVKGFEFRTNSTILSLGSLERWLRPRELDSDFLCPA
jgi:hypothetical protein